jgi:hypothetical protein
MAATRPRDLLSDDVLGRLGGTAGAAPDGLACALSADIARLADAGYLNVALPPELGGLGCTLRQAACGQRRLARHAPATALAVSAHLYWTGAAADALRAGDDSARWVLLEAARGALFAGGHGSLLPVPAGGTAPYNMSADSIGNDLRFADPRSRCTATGENGYRFEDQAVLSTMTPAWDWIAVHAVARSPRPHSVIAFAGRGVRSAPPFRVLRVSRLGTPEDTFTTSALTWGHSILASVQYSDARRAFNEAITAYAAAATADSVLSGPPPVLAGPSQDGVPPLAPGAQPYGRWPMAEASVRLDAMKARIAETAHPWQLVQEPAPDLGGQHLISLHAMRHEVATGAAAVYDVIARTSAASHSS